MIGGRASVCSRLVKDATKFLRELEVLAHQRISTLLLDGKLFAGLLQPRAKASYLMLRMRR